MRNPIQNETDGDDEKRIVREEDFQGTPDVSWGEEYLQDLFLALVDVIKERGVGKSGWESIRWEVYDKVCYLIGRDFIDSTCLL